MTGTEMLDELAKQDWQENISAVHHEARNKLQEIQAAILQVEWEQKDAEKEAMCHEKEHERESTRLEWEAVREKEKEKKQVEWEQAKQECEAERARIRANKENEKALAKQKREENKEKKKQSTGKRKTAGRFQTDVDLKTRQNFFN